MYLPEFSKRSWVESSQEKDPRERNCPLKRANVWKKIVMSMTSSQSANSSWSKWELKKPEEDDLSNGMNSRSVIMCSQTGTATIALEPTWTQWAVKYHWNQIHERKRVIPHMSETPLTKSNKTCLLGTYKNNLTKWNNKTVHCNIWVLFQPLYVTC